MSLSGHLRSWAEDRIGYQPSTIFRTRWNDLMAEADKLESEWCDFQAQLEDARAEEVRLQKQLEKAQANVALYKKRVADLATERDEAEWRGAARHETTLRRGKRPVMKLLSERIRANIHGRTFMLDWAEQARKLESDHEKMRVTLGWYRDEKNFDYPKCWGWINSPMRRDKGQRAHDLLKSLEVKNG